MCTIHSLGDYQRAVDYHKRALRLKQETGNKQEEASAYKNLGYAHHSLGDYQRAVDYHERELNLNRETRLVSIFINRKYVSFLYIKRYHMLNLLSCLDFVFVFRVFNFGSCPSRHMRYSRLPITRTFKGNRKKVRVIGSSKKIAESKVKTVFTAQ